MYIKKKEANSYITEKHTEKKITDGTMTCTVVQRIEDIQIYIYTEKDMKLFFNVIHKKKEKLEQ